MLIDLPSKSESHQPRGFCFFGRACAFRVESQYDELNDFCLYVSKCHSCGLTALH